MAALTKNVIGILLIGLGLLGACKSSETLPADQVSLRPNESARVGEITVQVDTLQQFGCVRCIIAYNAFVSAIISNTTKQQRVRLFFYGPPTNRHDSTSIILGGQTYKVILRDVTPHADSDYGHTQPVDNKVVIQVTKL